GNPRRPGTGACDATAGGRASAPGPARRECPRVRGPCDRLSLRLRTVCLPAREPGTGGTAPHWPALSSSAVRMFQLGVVAVLGVLEMGMAPVCVGVRQGLSGECGSDSLVPRRDERW